MKLDIGDSDTRRDDASSPHGDKPYPIFIEINNDPKLQLHKKKKSANGS